MGSRRKGTRKTFVSMGPAAERFADGLDRTQGGSSTYHMAQILKLVARIGHERVLDALRYATGYEAFNHTSVGRISRVRRLRGNTGAVEAALGLSNDGDHLPRQSRTTELGDERPSAQRPLHEYGALIREKSRATTTREEDDGE